MATKTVKAKKVREGDFLPGLGNGYVFTPPERNPDVRLYDGGFGSSVGEDTVLITFHDAYGEENYLIVGKNMPVQVDRR